MKKCLHLKKTKPHRRPKPPKVITRRERWEAERAEQERRRLTNLTNNLATLALFGRV